MTLAKFNKILAILYSIITSVLFIYNKDIQILLFLIYILIPFIFKIKPSYILIYLVFGFISILLGFLIHFYKILTWYDSFTHFIWGFVSCVIAIIVLKKLKMYNEKNLLFNIIFIFTFTLSLSCLWEVFEFIIDIIFKSDMQRKSTGVYDTMKDIIVAILGNVLFIIWYFYEYKYKIKLIVRKYIDLL